MASVASKRIQTGLGVRGSVARMLVRPENAR